MTDARVDRVEPDVWAARAFLEQAQRLLQDGAEERISPEGRQILLHGAVVAGCDAILAVNGRQIVGSDGGHRLRLATAQSLLPQDLDELFERLDDARMDRNEASYAAALLPTDVVEEALSAVGELVGLANAHVSPKLPPYLSSEGE